jgi:hypothetical protein
MTDNQEHDDTLECYTYVQKDGETISVSKATHSNIYDVVRYLVKEKKLTQPIKYGTPDWKKAQEAVKKRRQREKAKRELEASGAEPEHKKRKVPAKFKKTLRSFMFTCPRVNETEGVNARTQWLDVFKSAPNNTLNKALVVLEPHMSNEGTLDIWDDDMEEAKPPNHIHVFAWYNEPTDLLTIVEHLHAQMPGYMEPSKDSGIGLKGTFEFTPGKYGETNTSWAAHYCGIRDEHEPDSYAEVFNYKRIEGDSPYASGCGHLKTADASPLVYGFNLGTLFPLESRQASQVVKELAHKYLCFDLDLLIRRLDDVDRQHYKALVMNNNNYRSSTTGPSDLKEVRVFLESGGSLPVEPMEQKILRYASASFEEHGPGKGPFYRAIEGVFDNSPHIDKHALARDLYAALVYGPSKMRKVPFLWGDSNSGKSTVLKAIKDLMPTAVPVKNDSKFTYGNLACGTKEAFIWDDFLLPSFGDFHELLSAFEGEKGHPYRVMRDVVTYPVPIKFFVTCEKLPTKMKKDVSDAWVEDEVKTKHFHNRLAIHGPFNRIDVITGAGDNPCPKEFCQWLIDHKDFTRPPVDEADLFVRVESQ